MICLARNAIFRAIYWATSIFFIAIASLLVLFVDRQTMARWIRLYTRMVVFWMRWIAGIKITIRGKENIPDGPCVIAAKHQSWADGFAIYGQFDDLAFVTGDHLEKFPLAGGVLRKLGAIIVDNCGGALARTRLVDEALLAARREGRRILIYPEGHLAPAGQQYRYKKGVYHMYAAYDRPALPVATNLGLRWPQQSWRLTPGEAVIEFLKPIEPGLDKNEFMARLENMIEKRSITLLGDERPREILIGETLPDPTS